MSDCQHSYLVTNSNGTFCTKCQTPMRYDAAQQLYIPGTDPDHGKHAFDLLRERDIIKAELSTAKAERDKLREEVELKKIGIKVMQDRADTYREALIQMTSERDHAASERDSLRRENAELKAKLK